MRGRLDGCGARFQVGRGVVLGRYGKEARFRVGDDVRLLDGVRVVLEGPAAEVEIGDSTWLSERTEINAHERITIGSGCAISWEVLIMDGDYHRISADAAPAAPIQIGDRVWIGVRAMILKGITIGDGAVVAAGAVVSSDVPARSLVAGVPAKVMRRDVQWEA